MCDRRDGEKGVRSKYFRRLSQESGSWKLISPLDPVNKSQIARLYGVAYSLALLPRRKHDDPWTGKVKRLTTLVASVACPGIGPSWIAQCSDAPPLRFIPFNMFDFVFLHTISGLSL